MASLCGFQSIAIGAVKLGPIALGGIDLIPDGVSPAREFKGDEPRLSAYSVYSRGSRCGTEADSDEQENKETTLGADPDEFHWLPFFVSDTGAQYASGRHLGVCTPLHERISSACRGAEKSASSTW